MGGQKLVNAGLGRIAKEVVDLYPKRICQRHLNANAHLALMIFPICNIALVRPDAVAKLLLRQSLRFSPLQQKMAFGLFRANAVNHG